MRAIEALGQRTHELILARHYRASFDALARRFRLDVKDVIDLFLAIGDPLLPPPRNRPVTRVRRRHPVSGIERSQPPGDR